MEIRQAGGSQQQSRSQKRNKGIQESRVNGMEWKKWENGTKGGQLALMGSGRISRQLFRAGLGAKGTSVCFPLGSQWPGNGATS